MVKKRILAAVMSVLLIGQPFAYAQAAESGIEIQTDGGAAASPSQTEGNEDIPKEQQTEENEKTEESQKVSRAELKVQLCTEEGNWNETSEPLESAVKGIRIWMENTEEGSVSYRIKNMEGKWQEWKTDGEPAGMKGSIEALEIRLSESLAEDYTLRYRVNAEGEGWLGYAENGMRAGTEGMHSAIMGLEVVFESKAETEPFPENEKQAYIKREAESNAETETETLSGEEREVSAKTAPEMSVLYQTHVQDLGNMNEAADGEIAGTTNKKLRMEGISIRLVPKEEEKIDGGIRYRVHVQDLGWQDWETDGSYAGTKGKSLRVEAVQIELTGKMQQYYDVYYSAHVQQLGWLDWAKNGEKAGTEAFSYRMEAIKICLVKKGGNAPGAADRCFVKGYSGNSLLYSTHVQDYGTQKEVSSGSISGTIGKSKRVEGVTVRLKGLAEEERLKGGIRYRTHVQDIGWQDWKSDGAYAGTTGKALRAEAIQIELTGELAQYYDIYYTAHVQNFGWLGWAKNGQKAGSENYSYRMEALKICLVPKGGSAPGTNVGYFKQGTPNTAIFYSAHIQNIGNTAEVRNNQILGTTGRGLRMEGLKVRANTSALGKSGGIRYRAHVQNLGWQGWKQNGQMAGTSGKSYRLEAVQIELTGELAKTYDVYYRTHIQNFGWLGWAKNGQSAGSTGYSYRMEAIQIQLVPKDGYPPSNSGYFKEYTGKKNLNVPLTYQKPKYPNGCEAISLYMALRYNGYMVTTDEVCYKYMPRGPLHSTNPYLAYMGNPGSLTGGYGCWASVICKTAENYFKAAGIKNKTAKNITGTSVDGLYQYIDKGIPVVVWGTLNMGSTTWFKAGSSGGVSYYWPSRAHCVVLTGYDKKRNIVKVNDPIRGKVEYSRSSFERAYQTMNKNAMVIQ